MSIKLTLVLSITLLLMAIINTSVLAQRPSDSPHIFRIEVSECENIPIARRQTGFLVNNENVTGIVTALHGVADCPRIQAIGTESEFSELQIFKVDIERDVALLWSERIEDLSTGGLEIETQLEPREGDGLSTVGYPVNLDAPLPTWQMTLRGRTQLLDLIPDNLVKELLKEHKSPDVGIQVLSIEGHLLPGHSGAPIFNRDNHLIGVGNGGLDFGKIEIGWAIPWLEIDWKSVSAEDVARLSDLPEDIFIFNPSGEERIVKTVCISPINASYENINELKRDLLIEAQQQAVRELFGELIMVYTRLERSGLSENQIRTFTAGYVRVAGSPLYENHETNLAEVCVSIEAFATIGDRRKLEELEEPVEIVSDEVCVTEDLPRQKLQSEAEGKAVIRALVNYDSRLERQNKDELLLLMHNKDFSGSGFDSKTGAYCAKVKAEVLPIEIMALIAADGSPTPTPTVTPEPTPGVQISNVSNIQSGDTVSQTLPLIGTYAPEDIEDIWVFVGLPNDTQWPQSIDPCAGRSSLNRNGQWEVPIGIGGPEDEDKIFEITVTTANDEASLFLSNTVKTWCDTGNYPGLSQNELPDGLTVHERITARRGPGLWASSPDISNVSLPGQVTLDNIKDDDIIPPTQRLTGHYTTNATDHIWVLVYAVDNRYYPQSQDACQGVGTIKADGLWETMASFGGEGGKPFEIIVVLANEEAHAVFEARQENGCATGQFPGYLFIELPPGLDQKAKVSVTLQGP